MRILLFSPLPQRCGKVETYIRKDHVASSTLPIASAKVDWAYRMSRTTFFIIFLRARVGRLWQRTFKKTTASDRNYIF